jgi:hypothetical protein
VREEVDLSLRLDRQFLAWTRAAERPCSLKTRLRPHASRRSSPPSWRPPTVSESMCRRGPRTEARHPGSWPRWPCPVRASRPQGAAGNACGWQKIADSACGDRPSLATSRIRFDQVRGWKRPPVVVITSPAPADGGFVYTYVSLILSANHMVLPQPPPNAAAQRRRKRERGTSIATGDPVYMPSAPPARRGGVSPRRSGSSTAGACRRSMRPSRPSATANA